MPPSGDTPTAPTKLDALGDAGELQFVDSVVRYSHADREREQQAEPTYHAAMRYITIGWRRPCHPTFCRATPRTSVPPFRTSRKWLVKNDYARPTTTSSVLPVRNPTPPPTTSDEPSSVGRSACLLNDEPIRIYVSLLMRPWIMQACHSTTSCHLGTTRTMRMLGRFSWWIDMNVCTRLVASTLLEVPSAEKPRG